MRTEPVDIGCGVLSPLRSAALCAVYSFEHASHEPGMADDRPFGLHGLIATTAGQWVFRGRRGVIDIDSKITVAGTQGEHCGCRHAVPGNSILIAVMFPGSLDENEPPPFSEQVVEWDLARPLRLAMARNVDDDFESCLFEVFDLFARHTGGRGARPHGRLRMERVRRFIEKHAFETISLATIASCVNMSAFALLRQFKAHTGITPHEYLTSLRFERARKLLAGDTRMIAEIGADVGFRDQRYFSRWFRKEAGMTPRAFRKRYA
ncbi:MAG: AraC family transcriptional regulator [Candidatus Cybelea sp.]